MKTGVCGVVTSWECKAPANAKFGGPVGTCFRCGEDVCTAPDCSTRVSYLRFGRKRLCADCREEYAKDKARVVRAGKGAR